MTSTDNYKKIGIYENNSGERIFLVASSLTELKLYKGGDIITKGYSINNNSIKLDDIDYIKVMPQNIFGEFGRSTEIVAGSTKRRIRIGNKIIFKSAEKGNKSLGVILPEVSRNLIAISDGIPHALNYGIHKNNNDYYIIEEKVNVDDFEKYVCNIRKDIVSACNIQNNNIAELHKPISKVVSFALTENIYKIEECINKSEEAIRINEYISKYNAIQNIFKQKGIGGDTKLSNFGFKLGTDEFIVFDTIIPNKTNIYLPLDWDSWYNNEYMKEERKTNWNTNDKYDKFMLLFTNPIIRLLYKGCTKYPGITGGKRHTRKKINRKTHKCSRK